jgi:hypothetical protein
MNYRRRFLAKLCDRFAHEFDQPCEQTLYMVGPKNQFQMPIADGNESKCLLCSISIVFVFVLAID